MPKFIVEQYELYTNSNEIEAETPAEAVKLLLEATAPSADRDDCSDFLEIAEQYGMSAQANQALARQLRKLGVPVKDIIPSIRQVYPVRQE